MNEYMKYPTCFYVFDLHLCEEPINLVKNLDFTQNEDIIIISLKNIFKKELINIIKTYIEKYFNITKDYKFLNLKYTFQRNAFLILVKRILYNDVENIYYKNIEIYTKKNYGKIYRKIIKFYFNEYLEDKLNKKDILENEKNNSSNNNYKTALYKNMIQHKINNVTYNNFINKYFEIDKDNKRVSNSFLNKYEVEEEEKKKNENEYEKISNCSSDSSRKGKSIMKNMRISSNYSIDKRKKIFMKKEIKEDIKRKKKYDDNSLICLTFKIKNASFCIAFSNFDFYQYIEKLDYYKYIFCDYNRNNNKEDTVNFNYMDYYIKNYYMYCKQIYNYFINNIIFETKNEDLYLFNIDIIIFLGFDNFILFNYKKKNILNNNSFFFDQNITILNKNRKYFLQKKTYSTLTKEKERKLTFIGYKLPCDLFMKIEVDIIDDFFYKHFHEVKQKNKNTIISLYPKVIDFNLIHTYQIYQANFEISYDYKGNSENGSFFFNDKIFVNSSYYKYDKNMYNKDGQNKYFVMNEEKDYENKKELRNEDEEQRNEKKKKKKNYLLNILDMGSSKRKYSLQKKKEKNIHNEKFIYDEKYFHDKKRNNSKEFYSNNVNDENGIKKFQEKYDYIYHKKSNIFYLNDDTYLNGNNEFSEDKLYYSILCLDSKNNSTIPINLYSYLHLKKNSIFKYLEENIRFKKEGKDKILKSKNSLTNENNFDMLRYVYIYPYKGVIKKNSKKKIQLSLYVEHILNSEIINDSFILIIRIHNFVKDMFLTVKYSLKNNIVNSLLHSSITNPCDTNNNLNDINDDSNDINNLNLNKNKGNISNTNISLHNRKYNSNKKNKYNLNNVINSVSTNNIKITSFLSANFAKFIFYLFIVLDNYQNNLLNYKDDTIDDVFYFFRLTNLNNYHLLYSFNSILMNLQKNKRINFNYFVKKSFYIKYDDKKKLCSTFFIDDKMHKNMSKKYSGLPHEIYYLIEKLKHNEKIEKKISIESFLLLCEQLFYILNKDIAYCKFLDNIKNIYSYKISKNKKMYLIFYTILKNCSLFYKNLFLVFISFLKKLFTYFIKLSIHNFYVLVLKKTNTVDMNLLKKKKKHYFRLFLDAFNFFHISFLSYVSTFFFSFLDIQIALDLIHYLLFYL
ncbi:conserved Plasmodium protein, unknown function [Plasmodium relictum]|uniref:Uncharacterized protein n=1 Tax=Plasmodium relictum TaxID=85471 RepID=A0A1J1HC56_PLARL|nr:conserved Plasmodium protein, unknown function [Plasmodium relictum]CRH01153.1 conserved Plasmodium protein, unknown function [Plasmodium relictum]